MITQTFNNSPALISPKPLEEKIKCDAVIATFSYQIEQAVVEKFKSTQVGQFRCVNGSTPIYVFTHNGKTYGFYKTLLGAPASAGILEDVIGILDSDNYIVFGSAGTLDKSCHGKVVVPTHAYRDEGTSYHYQEASDYIALPNAQKVSAILKELAIPTIEGKTWTTDAFYRETKDSFEKRKAEGCLVVEMECSALQAVCNWRGKNLYYILFSGDLLDAPEWTEEGLTEANHSLQNFNIALALAQKL